MFRGKKIQQLEADVKTLQEEVERMKQAIQTHKHEDMTGKIYSIYQ